MYDPDDSPVEALLVFLATVLPSDMAAHIHAEPWTYQDAIEVSGTFAETWEASDANPVAYDVSNVVGTIGDVKARLVWAQVPAAD